MLNADQASRQIREQEQEQKQLNDFLMAHSLLADGSLSRRLKVNPVELDGGSADQKMPRRQMELDS